MGKKEKKPHSKIDLKKIVRLYSLPFALFIILHILIILTYQVILTDKFSLFTYIGDSNVSILTQSQAIRVFNSKFDQRVKSKLKFTLNSSEFTIDLATASAKIDYSKISQSFNSQHTSSILSNLQIQVMNILKPVKITPDISISIEPQIERISNEVYTPYKNAEISFNESPISNATASANIQIKESISGFALDTDILQSRIRDYLLTGKYNNTLYLKEINPKFTTEEANKAKNILESALREPVKFTYGDRSWLVDAKQLLTLLNLEDDGGGILDKSQTQTLIKNIALEIDQKVSEGLFEFNPDTKRVTAFRASKQGQRLNVDKTFDLLTDALNNSGKIIPLPVEIVLPKTQTEDVNNLGIKELLGRGISHFAGSIPNRIYNVNLTATKINGVLIPAGETFSFNQTVGDISAATGFKQAYVIKEGRTVLDDGGGVCQDSTTLFRAVLNAGLPVVKRTAHAYRVGYYEQGFPPGLDATIFYPSVDFQFKNDTSNYILIQAYVSGVTLTIDLYGTSDGRVSTLSAPVISNRTPAPPELRQDDPTLPKGVIKQVDFAAAGATVKFNRTVVKMGETLLNETWTSNYRPWQAIYLVGTQ